MAKEPTTVTPKETPKPVPASKTIKPEGKRTAEQTRPSDGNTSNPRKIQWPLDTFGFTTLLRKEGVRAIGRIKGHEQKYRIFAETLQTLASHAKAKYAGQQASTEIALARVEARVVEEAVREIGAKRRKIERLRAELAKAEADLAAVEEAPAPTKE